MPWNIQPQGVTPAQAQAGFQVHGTGISPGLLVQQHPISDAVQQAMKVITGILDERRRDKIANQLLAVDNAANYPSVEKSGDETDPNNPGAYALKGLPTSGDLGGVRAYVERLALEKQQQERLHQKLVDDKLAADIDRVKHPVFAPRQPPAPPNPITQANFDRQEFERSPQWQDYLEKNKQYESNASALNAVATTHGLTIPDIPQIDFNSVKFVAGRDLLDKDNNPLTRPKIGDDGKPIVQKGGWFGHDSEEQEPIKTGTQLSEDEANHYMNQFPPGQGKPGAGILAQGKTANGKDFSMSLADYYAILNRHHSLGEKPVMPERPKSSGGAQHPDGTRVEQGGVLYEFQNGVAVPVKQ